MRANIVVLPGDGIGPEVIAAGVAALKAVAEHGGHEFEFAEHAIGERRMIDTTHSDPSAAGNDGRSVQRLRMPCCSAPIRWTEVVRSEHAKLRPEQGLLALRAALGVYAKTCAPCACIQKLTAFSPLKDEKLRNVDMLFLRELTGGRLFRR